MNVGLTYTQMKLGWGRRRLDELKREVEEFRKDAYLVHDKDDFEQSRYRICIEQKITPDPIGMLVGEFAYAMPLVTLGSKSSLPRVSPLSGDATRMKHWK